MAGSTTRYLSWISLSGWPTWNEIENARGKYSVVVFNSDRLEAARHLRAIDPGVTILFYLDLSSVRSYDGSKPVTSGVAYNTAVANDWLARDTSGNLVTWPAYPAHWQAKVWDAAYQQAWVSGAVSLASDPVWDGVLADNDMSSLKYYTNALFQGTTTSAQTDNLQRTGVDALIDKAGKALNAASKSLVVNVSDGRLNPSRWDQHSVYGGAMEENFMAWSRTANEPQVWNWPDNGWAAQRNLIERGPRSMAMTSGNPGDARTQVYGYASFLLGAEAGDAWTGPSGEPGMQPYDPKEVTIALGSPLGAAVTSGNVATRNFAGGWVAVNPSQSSVTVTAPSRMVDVNGAAIGTRTLAPMSGLIGARS